VSGSASDTSARPRQSLAGELSPALRAALNDYLAVLERPGGALDTDTVRVYRSRIGRFLEWLSDADVDGEPLTDAAARDWAVRDYRTYLLTVAGRKPSTVNAHMTAIADFYRRRGLGPAAARREDLPKAAPRALDPKAQMRWLRAAERAPRRDRALAHVGFYAGLRIGEIVALNVDDVRMSARKGHLVVRYGKGGRYREVPLHPVLRTTLQGWLEERANWPGAKENLALFLNRRGGRLSTRGAYDVLTSLADEAGIAVGRSGDFTPHVLRHTAGTTLTRAGTDIVLVAEILGHSVETARRYALPSEDDRQAAIERLPVDR
jgi:site-specific recombinase XerD